VRDARFSIKRDGKIHIVSENYSYKTDTYYTILKHELDGTPVLPASQSVIDAYVVPICLERAKRAGIPTHTWGISQGYAPVPSILYGLNYFSNASDFVVVRDEKSAKEARNHVTNMGKYPFCYQLLEDGVSVHSCISIFGKTDTTDQHVSDLAESVYKEFCIPVISMIYVKFCDEFCEEHSVENQYALSAIAPTKYTQFSEEERRLISAYVSKQEFL
jgi:hypothetical protein